MSISRKFKSYSPLLGAAVSAAVILPAVLFCVDASRAAPAKRPAAPGLQTRAELEQRFATTVKPLLQTYCVSCHGKDKPQAQLDLSSYTSMDAAAADYPHLGLMVERLTLADMPPKGVAKRPTAAQNQAILSWLKGMRKYEAERNAGDPGLVLARRLSNAEYDYSLRDLTGADIHPSKEFPVDPANEAGFDNSGESLTVSPSLMKKYLQAARGVADHLVLNSTGLAFANHPVLVETDRDKYSILRIVDFYKRQPTDFADYFEASWRFRHRAALGTPNATLQQVAAQSKVSPRYLELVWATLSEPAKVGPLAKLQTMFNALPAPDAAKPNAARAGCEAMREWVQDLREKVASKFDNLQTPGFSPGGQWNLLWKDRQYAANRRVLNPQPLQIDGKPQPLSVDPRPRRREKPKDKNNQGPELMEVDADLAVPADAAARAPYLESFKKFCNVFPDAFYIAERGRMEFYDPGDRGRLLVAGFHNMMGYFRDDQPLMELILDDNGRKELNKLWVDFDMVAQVQERMHLEFIFYERAEAHTITEHDFDFARSEDKDAISDAKIKHLAEVYLGKARRLAGDRANSSPAIKAMEDHFRLTSEHIRAIEKVRLAAEPAHLNALLDFARRAYRRPLTPAERTDLLAFYKASRQKTGLNHEEAIRDTLVTVLMSPNFLYRVDDAAASAPARAGSVKLAAAAAPKAGDGDTVVKPLSDYALASRLSYFLWSSVPDEELLAHAAKGDLHRPDVLSAQARRMVKDPRVRALATEFGANWLDFRRFEEHNAVDRARFPTFTDDLRTAMFEEPIRFLTDQLQNDGSLLDLLYGKYTFVNGVLAKHYKMDDVKVAADTWVRVDNADKYGRGGLLPMGVFLTQNSPGLRTSPVKRGYWLVRKVLGEHIPPPPATVPELPKDEGQLGDKTLRQALERHRQDPACAGCHARFDAFGLVFEGYGPIGDQRTKDLGGKQVDTRAPFPGGVEKTGLSGLREYLRERRETDFLDNFCRKLLSYSLGRGLQASDDPLLLQMRQKLTGNGYRIGTLVDAIVTSKQFRNRRASASFAAN